MLEKQEKRQKRHKRVRSKILGTASRPRLCVFRSLNHSYAQLIDDEKGKTLVSASDIEIKKTSPKIPEDKKLGRKAKKSYELGRLIAQKAVQKKIENAVFDRAGYKYHGRIRALAEGARAGGLKF